MAHFTQTTGKAYSKGRDSENESSRKGISAPAVSAFQMKAAIQKMSAEEEEPLQGKFDTVQKMAEEEEPLQGKFRTAQLMAEEEEPLQGKFETTQLAAEEEEPLQGKFQATQLMAEEEETLQGKFETAQLAAEEEEPLQGKFEPVQKMAEEEEPLQGKLIKPFQMKQAGGNAVTQLQQEGASNNSGLPGTLRSGIESLSGFSMNDVKVHYNSSKPAQLQAHAYAQGTDIHLAPGQEKHLPHEAWHVAQQKQGRVKPTIQMKRGVPVNDDAGLEHEADVMGARAVEAGKNIGASVAQTKQAEISPFAVQRKVAQRAGEAAVAETPEQAYLRENANIIGMISNAGLALSKVKWHSLGAESDNLGTGLTIGGLTGSATGGAGSATGALQGTSKPDVSGAAGDITAGVGASIGSLVKTVLAIKELVTSEKKDGMLVGGGKVASAILSALKSGFEAAASIQKFVTGSVSPAIVSLIPGLGIAIAACEFIKNAYMGYNAYSAENAMQTVSGEFKDELIALLSGLPEVQAPTLFATEKRGKLFNRQTYTRLKPGLFEAIAQITDTGISAEQRTQRMANFRRMHNLPPTVNIHQLASAIRSYELGSKMQEINQKRKVQGARNIFTNLLSIAGEIAKFFPADGGITAGVLLGASAGIGGVQAAGKFVQGLARNHGILGGDTNRSSAQKHKEYVNHTKAVYEYLAGIPQPVTKASSAKVSKSESLLKATGANLDTVYKADYTNDASVTDQAKHIVESMKAGR